MPTKKPAPQSLTPDTALYSVNSNTLSAPSPSSPAHPPSGGGSSGASGSFQLFPRAASPSSAITGFLSKPSKWFGKDKAIARAASADHSQPRASFSSPSGPAGFGRKPKISRPTDPRPILPTMLSEPYMNGVGSRSVVDLSHRPTHSPTPPIPSLGSPSSLPRTSGSLHPSPGLSGGASLDGSGDLLSISRKGWSHSADDLSRVHVPAPRAPLVIDTTDFRAQVERYRAQEGSLPTTPGGPLAAAAEPQSPEARDAKAMGTPTLKVFPAGPASPEHEREQTRPERVHARSQSFAARITKRPPAPRGDIPLPPTPVRQASAGSVSSSVRELGPPHPPQPIRQASAPSPISATPVGRVEPMRERTRTTSGGAGQLSAAARGFPWAAAVGLGRPLSPGTMAQEGEGTGGAHARSASRGTLMSLSPLPPPPVIIEPPQESTDEARGQGTMNRRASQLLHHSGFINRMMTFAPSSVDGSGGPSTASSYWGASMPTQVSLAKGWKPFKAELKGSKMYFYKTPSDRAAAAKELFPEGVEPELEEVTEEEPIHQPLSVPGENNAGGGGGGGRRGGGRQRRAYWGRKTHPDLGMDKQGKVEKGTMEALVHEAVFGTTFRKEEGPVEGEAKDRWQDFAEAVVLALPASLDRAKFEAEFTRCAESLVSGADDKVKEADRERVSWMAGRYVALHGPPIDEKAWETWRAENVPDLLLGEPQKTKAVKAILDQLPVPKGHKSSSSQMSFMDMINSDPSEHARARDPTSAGALAHDGFTRDALFAFDPHVVARSLTLFNRDAFALLTQEAITLLAVTDATSTISAKLAPFSGSSEHPHWLTKLVLSQVLLADPTSSNARRPSVDGRANSTGPPQARVQHSRAGVIAAWAFVGELCRLQGDECAWKAIEKALTARPVARLAKAWKRVDERALAAVESWVSGALHQGPQKTVVPWYGAKVEGLRKALAAVVREGTEEMMVRPMEEARTLFSGLGAKLEECAQEINVAGWEGAGVLAKFWKEFAVEGQDAGGVSAKLTRVEQFMPFSLAAEPRRVGAFEPHFWNQSTAPPPHHPLLPLLFPEPLPTLSFIDRQSLARARNDSGQMTPNKPDATFFRQVNAQLQPESGAQLNKDTSSLWMATGESRDVAGQIIRIDEELLVLVPSSWDTGLPSRPPSRSPSRPPSGIHEGATLEKTLVRAKSIRDLGAAAGKTLGRNTSIRVHNGEGPSPRLGRSVSMARRSSLPMLSPRPSLLNMKAAAAASKETLDKPLRVVIHAGTVDRLVAILIHGLEGLTVSASDDSGEAPLKEKKSRKLKVDREEFAKIWWNVFRSYVSPLVFFELLRKQYVGSGAKTEEDELLPLIRTRLAVLSVLREWIRDGGGAQDVLDDAQLHDVLKSFVFSGVDHHLPSPPEAEEDDVQAGQDKLVSSLEGFKRTFEAQIRRPTMRHESSRTSLQGTNLGRDLPDIDSLTSEELVVHLDAMAAAACSVMVDEDLLVTADLLELQSADRTGWFLSRDSSALPEDLEIQTIHAYLYDAGVEPSSLIPILGQDRLYRLLPPGVRTCLRAHDILRKWLITKLAAPRLGVATRQSRIESFLTAVEICRRRSAGVRDANIAEQPVVRSFAESVLVSALVSPESRAQWRAWMAVSSARNAYFDWMFTLLSNPSMDEMSARSSLTTDIGWLLERLLEVITMPNVLDEGGRSLVNFEKRRHIYNLILHPRFRVAHSGHTRSKTNTHAMERLNKIEKEVNSFSFDLRYIKDDANREGNSSAPSNARRIAKPFSRLVELQYTKNRRDRALRDRLVKEKRAEQSRHDRREDQLNRAMQPQKRPANQVSKKEHRTKKSVSSAFNFLQFMRPISSAFTSESSVFQPGVKHTPEELDFATSGKPSLVLSVADARVVKFINNERSFLFQLDTEDGGHYLLQAINRKDMVKWMDAISRLSKIAARRRLTWMGNSPKPQIMDHIPDRPTPAPKDPRAVFGVDLLTLLKREAPNGELQPGAIPLVLERCLTEIENRGMEEVGIYRIAGAKSEIAALKEAFDRGINPIEPYTDIHAVCDIVKMWLRQLPDAAWPTGKYHEAIEAAKLKDLDARLHAVRRLVHDMPQISFDLLKRLSEHWFKVTEYEDNQMGLEALSIVVIPNLLRSPVDDLSVLMGNMGPGLLVVRALIGHFHVIFDDEPEAEDEDDELEPSIPEEPEDAETSDVEIDQELASDLMRSTSALDALDRREGTP